MKANKDVIDYLDKEEIRKNTADFITDIALPTIMILRKATIVLQDIEDYYARPNNTFDYMFDIIGDMDNNTKFGAMSYYIIKDDKYSLVHFKDAAIEIRNKMRDILMHAITMSKDSDDDIDTLYEEESILYDLMHKLNQEIWFFSKFLSIWYGIEFNEFDIPHDDSEISIRLIKRIKNISYILEEILEYSVNIGMKNNPVYTDESTKIIVDEYVYYFRRILDDMDKYIKIQRD